MFENILTKHNYFGSVDTNKERNINLFPATGFFFFGFSYLALTLRDFQPQVFQLLFNMLTQSLTAVSYLFLNLESTRIQFLEFSL